MQVPRDDVSDEATADEIVAKLASTVALRERDGGAIKEHPKREARLVKRLYDKLRLVSDIDDDHAPEGETTAEVTLKPEQYKHLTKEDLEMTRKTISEVSSFFMKGKFPT